LVTSEAGDCSRSASVKKSSDVDVGVGEEGDQTRDVVDVLRTVEGVTRRDTTGRVENSTAKRVGPS